MLQAGNSHFVTLRERLLYLRTLPLVGTMPSSDLAILAEYARERVFRAGETLLREGEPAHAVHLVVDGSVQVARRGKPFRLFGPRDAAGVFAMLARTHDGVQATALSDTLALEIHRDALLDAFEDHFSMLHHVLREVTRLLIDERSRIPGAIRQPEKEADALVCPSRSFDLVERIFFLRRSVPFGHSNINALAALARRAKLMRLDPDVRLWKEGDSADTAMLIVCGEVSGLTDSGEQRFLFGPRAAVGALDSIAGVPRVYSAVTASEVVAMQLRIEDLLDVLEDHTEAAMEFLAAHARDMIATFERRAALEPDSVQPRGRRAG